MEVPSSSSSVSPRITYSLALPNVFENLLTEKLGVFYHPPEKRYEIAAGRLIRLNLREFLSPPVASSSIRLAVRHRHAELANRPVKHCRGTDHPNPHREDNVFVIHHPEIMAYNYDENGHLVTTLLGPIPEQVHLSFLCSSTDFSYRDYPIESQDWELMILTPTAEYVVRILVLRNQRRIERQVPINREMHRLLRLHASQSTIQNILDSFDLEKKVQRVLLISRLLPLRPAELGLIFDRIRTGTLSWKTILQNEHPGISPRDVSYFPTPPSSEASSEIPPLRPDSPPGISLVAVSTNGESSSSFQTAEGNGAEEIQVKVAPPLLPAESPDEDEIKFVEEVLGPDPLEIRTDADSDSETPLECLEEGLLDVPEFGSREMEELVRSLPPLPPRFEILSDPDEEM